MTASVLLGVPDAETANGLTARLHETGSFQVVGAAATSGEVLDGLPRTEPLVLVVSDEIGPVSALDLVREVGTLFPQVAVVLLSRDATPELFDSAMAAGARGVLSADATTDEIENRLTPAAAWARNVRHHFALGRADDNTSRGTVVTVTGAKGGVGTTTIAVHIALAAAARGGRSVCLVDMDLQTGDVANLLDIVGKRTVADLARVADDLSPPLLRDVLFRHPTGVSVLLAPAEGERSDEVTDNAARRILGALRSLFDVVVVDAGSVVTDGGAVAVEMADRVALVVTPDVLALRAARRHLALLTRLHVRKDDDVTIVLNRASRHSDVQPDTARRVIGARVATAIVPADFKALQGAVNAGDPALVEDVALRRAFHDLAVELGVVDDAPAVAGASPARRGRRRREAGQATVETVAMLPLLLVVMVVLWQVALAGYTFVLAGHAADVGARIYAVDDEEAARREALDGLPQGWREGANLSGSRAEGRYDVSLKVPVLFPGFGSSLRITGSAAVVSE